MAAKITPKNLSYDTSLPPFLQRLHSQNTSLSSDGRHERPIARPRRARDPDAEADDEPTYVNESTNHTLSKEEYAELVGGGREGGDDGEKDGEAGGEVAEGEERETAAGTVDKEKVAAIGVGRKRKAGKVVGGGEHEDGKEKAASTLSVEKVEKSSVEGTKKSERPKKGKKIKLSFNDEEEQ